MSKRWRNSAAGSPFSKSHMSGAVFKKLMAEIRSGGMYLYFIKMPFGEIVRS
jgi:hypothetical protein